MATREEKFITTVELNAKEAEDQLKDLEKKAKIAYEAMDKAYKAGDKEVGKKLEKDWKKAEKAVKQFKMQTSDVSGVLNRLSDASLQQLTKASRALNAQIRNLAPNTEEFKRKAEELRSVRARLDELRAAGNAQEGWMSKLTAGVNRWGATLSAAAGAITGLSMTIRKSVDDYAQMEEAMANVRKYTGWSDEEVRNFNEDLKQMDTRSSREHLNELAGDAGRLGITSHDAALEFVDAADKISVALGDDLGKDAVATIGKLSDSFGDSDRMGLRGAMLATGSAVNELAASSSAAAGYLVDFTSRLAGASIQAGIGQTAIMGYASVLDQNMQQVETSATALSQLVTKMFQDPAKFAKLAGKDVKEFTTLLKTDANEALLQFLQSMQSKGGFDALAPMFNEMGLSGTRCVGVLSTLATNLDEVKRQQDIAAKAFEEGTSVLDEFNVQNNTVQAGIDKAKKQFLEVSVALGEKLMPVVKYTISSTSLLVKGLSALVDIIITYRQWIIAAIVSMAAFKASLIVTSLVEGLTKAVKACSTAFQALKAAMMGNWFGIIATAIAAAAAALWTYNERQKEAAQKARELQKTEEEALKNYTQQAAKVKALSRIVHDSAIALDERKKALDELNKIVPGYNGLLDEEGRLTRENKKAIDDYLVSLEKEIKLKAYKDKLEELYKRQADLQDTRKEQNDKYWDVRQTNTLQGYDRNSVTAKISRFFGLEEEGSLKKAVEKTDAEISDVNSKIESMMAKIKEVGGEASSITGGNSGSNSSGGNGGTGGSGGGPHTGSSTDDAEKKAVEKSKQIMNERLAVEEIAYVRGERLLTEYQDNKYAIEQENFDRLLSIYKKDSDDYKNTLNAKTLAEAKYAKDLQKHDEGEVLKRQEIARREIEMSSLTAEQKKEALFQIDVQYLQERMNCYEQNSEEWNALELELTQMQEQHKYDLRKKYEDEFADFKKQFLPLSSEEEQRIWEAYARELYDKKLLSEEEYQKALASIREKYKPKDDEEKEENLGFGNLDDVTSKLSLMGEAIEELNNKIKEGGKASWKDYAKIAGSALNTVMGMMSALGNLAAATAQAEIATTEAKYKRLIDAAEGNEEEQKRLEEQKNKEIKKIKLRQAESERGINVAQALMNVGLGIMEVWANWSALPAVAAALSAAVTAMGAVQVATINKQYEAQVQSINSGYYEGGYTGGKRYRKEAGVVHEGEFVANHEAVNNPEIRPMLDLIDQAQRNNTVGSLTADDLRAVSSITPQQEAPVVNVSTDNSDLRSSLARMNESMDELNKQLAEGLHTKLSMQEFKRQEKHYEKLMSNK